MKFLKILPKISLPNKTITLINKWMLKKGNQVIKFYIIMYIRVEKPFL